MRHGQMLDMWYHVKCFKERREELEFVRGVDTIPGFKDLTADDKKVLSKELPALSAKYIDILTRIEILKIMYFNGFFFQQTES